MLIVSFVLILLAAELFTNAVEWFGRRLKLGEGAVGSVVAAVGTALPETSISIVAIIMGASAGGEAGTRAVDAGIGAILGAPMMLATLAMFVTGAAVLHFSSRGRRSKEMHVNYEVIGRDLRTFFIVYGAAIAASFIPWHPAKVAVGALLVVIYIGYVLRTFRNSKHSHKEEEEELKRLHFHRRAARPRLRMILVQILAGIALMITGAEMFLESVSEIGHALGVSTLVLSLIIAPIATELPEKFNSITWVRERKDTLALGNISGAMVFQSSITPAIGLMFTPWILGDKALVSALIALVAAGIIGGEMMRRKRISPYSLLVGGLLYALYPIYVFVIAR
jgi:cation:H+ antiporter